MEVQFSTGLKDNNLVIKKLSASEQSIRLANRWLDKKVNFAEAIAAASDISAHARWAAVSKIKPNCQKVEIIALFDNGGFVDCFTYDFNQTPCEQVLAQDKFCHFSSVQHAFPNDKDLQTMGIEDYAGLSFTDMKGNKVGHIFIMHDSQLENLLDIEQILTSMTSLLRIEWQ